MIKLTKKTKEGSTDILFESEAAAQAILKRDSRFSRAESKEAPKAPETKAPPAPVKEPPPAPQAPATPPAATPPKEAPKADSKSEAGK